MTDITKALPTQEMQEEFERFKRMSPEERRAFQEERARKAETLTPEERASFKQSTHEGLEAIKEGLSEINAQIELGEVAEIISLSYIAKTYFGKSKSWLYQRINGNRVNGKPARFTDDERHRFAQALQEMSRKIEETSLKFA
ncbi:MAG: DUF5053 domain-containing protein [Parabacteroides sp.]|nr:DUF5053 domain-containing protein [Parabacteroides sp.]